MAQLQASAFDGEQLTVRRWHAVSSRDRTTDGTFVYAVRTTGIYCRPSCSSRRPKRANVSFFSTPAEAERAGFRACLRCRPTSGETAKNHAIIEACRRIETSERIPNLTELARHAGLSVFHFQRLFKAHVGMTPKAYALARRGELLRKSLITEVNITTAIYESGYESSSRFYATAKEQLGMSPSDYKNGGGGEEIRFAVGHCSLGAILVAATSIGICAIDLGDDAEELLNVFQKRFPKAQLIGDDPKFEALVALAILQVDQPMSQMDLPLDIQGTVFQRRVWEELKKIPAGTTVSYAELAQKIGRAEAVRAVAGACASNTIAIAIPCHRVVRTDGNLSGYRWGIERKRLLLTKEKAR